MFMGEYEHSVDDKGRLIIPARFREELGLRFVVTRGLDRCLFVYPLGEWGKLVEEKLQTLPLGKTEARAFVRTLMSGATECELDKQGRIILPANLRAYAGLEKDVVVIGVSSRVEIWSKAEWEKYSAAAEASFGEIAETVVGL
ncbi:MAG: division/cell wall cluster transcriptional repressor MraZ [Betaproteobacteria bacterium]